MLFNVPGFPLEKTVIKLPNVSRQICYLTSLDFVSKKLSFFPITSSNWWPFNVPRFHPFFTVINILNVRRQNVNFNVIVFFYPIVSGLVTIRCFSALEKKQSGFDAIRFLLKTDLFQNWRPWISSFFNVMGLYFSRKLF